MRSSGFGTCIGSYGSLFQWPALVTGSVTGVPFFESSEPDD